MRFKNIFYILIFILLICSGCNNQPEQIHKKTILQEGSDVKTTEKISIDKKKYFGKWSIDSCFGVGVPSTWGKEIENFIGEKLELSEDFMVFNDVKLCNILYKEETLSSEELDLEYRTTYETLGLPFNSMRVKIYQEDNTDKTMLVDCVVYEFFMKDDDTLIAANRNMYFILIRE